MATLEIKINESTKKRMYGECVCLMEATNTLTKEEIKTQVEAAIRARYSDLQDDELYVEVELMDTSLTNKISKTTVSCRVYTDAEVTISVPLTNPTPPPSG